jgi:hypothetical protein
MHFFWKRYVYKKELQYFGRTHFTTAYGKDACGGVVIVDDGERGGVCAEPVLWIGQKREEIRNHGGQTHGKTRHGGPYH